MLTIFELIKFSFGSLIWGLLMAVVIMALFFVLLGVFCPNSRFSPATYIISGVTGLLLASQCVLVCGSVKLLGYVDDIRSEAAGLINAGIEAGRTAADASADAVGNLLDEYPVISKYADIGSFDSASVSAVPQIVADRVSDGVKSYILRRVWWMLGFVVIGMLAAMKTMVRHRMPVMPGMASGHNRMSGIGGGASPRIPGVPRRRL